MFFDSKISFIKLLYIVNSYKNDVTKAVKEAKKPHNPLKLREGRRDRVRQVAASVFDTLQEIFEEPHEKQLLEEASPEQLSDELQKRGAKQVMVPIQIKRRKKCLCIFGAHEVFIY